MLLPILHLLLAKLDVSGVWRPPACSLHTIVSASCCCHLPASAAAVAGHTARTIKAAYVRLQRLLLFMLPALLEATGSFLCAYDVCQPLLLALLMVPPLLMMMASQLTTHILQLTSNLL